MQLHSSYLTLLTLLLSLGQIINAKPQPPGKNAILLSTVQSLTLHSNRLTTSRRISPIPQLKCVGPPRICKLYQVDSLRCKNEGFDYDEEDIQWTCTTPLPAEFKLGSTDVLCEGYRDSDDKWILKGSCGVEYRLLLTDAGEERFGKSYSYGDSWSGGEKKNDIGSKLGAWIGELIFWGFFIAVALIIFVPLLARCFGIRTGDIPRAPRRRWGWGGGGGGGDDGFYPGPPPPYTSFSSGDCSQNQGWRPGFWTGAAGGAAAGYQMGRNSRGSQRTTRFNESGEGSSRSPSQFSTTTTGTGFGSTRRR